MFFFFSSRAGWRATFWSKNIKKDLLIWYGSIFNGIGIRRGCLLLHPQRFRDGNVSSVSIWACFVFFFFSIFGHLIRTLFIFPLWRNTSFHRNKILKEKQVDIPGTRPWFIHHFPCLRFPKRGGGPLFNHLVVNKYINKKSRRRRRNFDIQMTSF